MKKFLLICFMLMSVSVFAAEPKGLAGYKFGDTFTGGLYWDNPRQTELGFVYHSYDNKACILKPFLSYDKIIISTDFNNKITAVMLITVSDKESEAKQLVKETLMLVEKAYGKPKEKEVDNLISLDKGIRIATLYSYGKIQVLCYIDKYVKLSNDSGVQCEITLAIGKLIEAANKTEKNILKKDTSALE